MPFSRWLTGAIYAVCALVGVAAFLYPFFLPQLAVSEGAAHLADAPWLTLVLLLACLGVLVVEVQGQVVSAKVIATLGLLSAMTAVLRFIETAMPGPGGFTPVFTPIILAGFVFGSRFGFLLGVLSLLMSALITGGVGPWLPYQMFLAGWIGLTAGWLPHLRSPRHQIWLLSGLGVVWGFLFGLIMNLYFWPFVSGGWQAGLPLRESIARYATFYLATSFIWDCGGALGNVLLIGVVGLPVVKALTRFRDRFIFVRETEQTTHV